MISGVAVTRASVRTRLLDSLRRVLSSPAVPVAIPALVLLLSLPTVRMGFLWDDLIHRTMMVSVADTTGAALNPWHPAGEPATRLSMILRMFTRISPDVNARLRDLGLVPWWTDENVAIIHLRPLSALTHWWDFLLWGDRAVPMHLENILLYSLVCLLAVLLYRRLSGPLWVAGLAALMFAVDDGHLIPVAWIANRNGLLALLFGLLTLIAHDRWRREDWKAGAVLAPLLLTLSTASAELGIAAGAYILAHAVFLEEGRWHRRLVAVAPYLPVGAAWFLVYHRMGYGAFASGLYVDPGREPLRFLDALARQGPVMLLGQTAAVDTLPYYLISAPARIAFWLGTMVFLVVAAALFWQLLRKDRVAGFWGLGMLLSVVLVSGISATTARPLLFAGIGAMPLLARFIWKTVDGTDPLFRRAGWAFLTRALCAWFVLLHLVFSPVHFTMRTLTARPPLLDLEPVLDFSAAGLQQGQDLIVVNPPNTFAFLYASGLRAFLHQPAPAHVRILAPGVTSLLVTRLDSVTLSVRPSGGFLLQPGTTIGDQDGGLPLMHPAYYFQHFDETFRIRSHPLQLHERIDLSGMSAEVTSLTGDGRPAEARMRFAVPLESAGLNWLRWDWELGTYVRFALPGIGGSVSIAGPPAAMPIGLGFSGGEWRPAQGAE